MDLKKVFYRLVKIGSPSGFEEPMIIRFKEMLAPYVDEVWDTPRGNVVAVQYGTDSKAPKVALAAHLDQVGFVVQNIDERGFIKFRRIGGVISKAIQCQHIRFITEEGPVHGVVGVKPGHVTPPQEARTVPKVEDMYIDVGARNRSEVEDMGIHIGTPAVIDMKPIELANDLIASPAVDDRAGLTSLIGVASALKNKTIASTVYYIGTVEEEIGLRGASVVLNDLDVDMAVAIDTFPAGWQPDVRMRDILYEVGKGPAVHLGETGGGNIRVVHHHRIRRWLTETADRKRIPYQTGFMHGSTDASAMAKSKGGVPTVAFGIPRRYSHSPVEVFDIKDLESLVKIFVQALSGLDSSFRVNRV
jgi:endoglucanase